MSQTCPSAGAEGDAHTGQSLMHIMHPTHCGSTGMEFSGVGCLCAVCHQCEQARALHARLFSPCALGLFRFSETLIGGIIDQRWLVWCILCTVRASGRQWAATRYSAARLQSVNSCVCVSKCTATIAISTWGRCPLLDDTVAEW